MIFNVSFCSLVICRVTFEFLKNDFIFSAWLVQSMNSALLATAILSVCPSHSWNVINSLQISHNGFHFVIAPSLVFGKV